MNKEIVKEAIKLAEEKSADGQHGPFGAVIAKGDEIISKGWNSVVENQDPTAHAEIVAIRKACENLGTHILEGCVLYTSCEPCPMCMSAIYWARIDKVVFASSAEDAGRAGFDDAFFWNEMKVDWQDRKVEMIQECSELGKVVFDKWIANPDKLEY